LAGELSAADQSVTSLNSLSSASARSTSDRPNPAPPALWGDEEDVDLARRRSGAFVAALPKEAEPPQPPVDLSHEPSRGPLGEALAVTFRELLGRRREPGREDLAERRPPPRRMDRGYGVDVV